MKCQLIFWIFFLSYTCSGQSNIEILNNIRFEGLKKNKETYLNQQLRLQPGDTINEFVIHSKLQRLSNLYSILNADYNWSEGDLTFFIEEKKTLLPIINFGGIKENIWFQLGFSDINLHGLGHQIAAYYQNADERHTVDVYYKIPYLGKSEWGLSANIKKWSSVEPLFFDEGPVSFNYDNNAIGLSGIRHFGFHHEIELGLSAFREIYKKLSIQDLENPPGPDKLTQDKLLFKLAYIQDKVDYYDFRLDKHRFMALLQTVYTKDDNSYFQSFITEWRRYFRVMEKGNIGLKLRGAISTNNDTPFAPFVVDSHVNLRGVGNRIDRGTAQLIINLEYRHAIVNKTYWASQIIVFTDAGSWRNPGGSLDQLFDPDQFRQFIGGGFRIIYKKMYNAILRVDYGVDVFNTDQKGIVIGIGQYF